MPPFASLAVLQFSGREKLTPSSAYVKDKSGAGKDEPNASRVRPPPEALSSERPDDEWSAEWKLDGDRALNCAASSCLRSTAVVCSICQRHPASS